MSLCMLGAWLIVYADALSLGIILQPTVARLHQRVAVLCCFHWRVGVNACWCFFLYGPHLHGRREGLTPNVCILTKKDTILLLDVHHVYPLLFSAQVASAR